MLPREPYSSESNEEEARENSEYFSQQEKDKQREQEPAKESDDDLEPFYEELDRECDTRNMVASQAR